MKTNAKRLGIYLTCIIIALIFTVGIYIIKTYSHHPDSITVSAKSIKPGGKVMDDNTTKSSKRTINKNGNADYYNLKDGLYYADKDFKVRANDNTEYLLSLFNSGKDVNLPEGNFLCKANIPLTGRELKVTGVKGKTKIIFECKDFSYIITGPFSEGLIVNRNYANEYVEATAQVISISNIDFEYKRYQEKSPVTMMLFKNVKTLNITGCSFLSDLSNEIGVTNLDLYNACKKVTVTDCYFNNRTKANHGGCIWVRNLTSQSTAVEGNTTENVYIRNCEFDKDSKDEVISVYSTIGNVRDVVITDCKIRDYFTGQDTVLSAISSEDKYYGTVDSVLIANNYIYSANFNAFMISTGLENRKKPTRNIVISNNEIISDSQSTRRRIIIYNPSNNRGSNIIVTGNKISSKPNTAFYAIANATYANENIITGNIESGIVGGTVTNNVITGAVNGIVNPESASKNVVSQAKYGIRVYQNDSYLYSNSIELDKATGVCGVEVLSADYVTVAKNKIQTTAATQYGYIAKNPNTFLQGNQISGDGKTTIG